MIDRAVAATRQLAKRQMTWLRKLSQKHAFDCTEYRQNDIFELLSDVFAK
jgi:tRNA A37 N6-isopentenylltransferase MiaA